MRQDLRYRVLRLLEADPDMSQRALARALGISLGGVHGCLRGLVTEGLVSVGKGGRPYLLTRAGRMERRALAQGFLGRKRAEHAALGAEISALEAEIGPKRRRFCP